MTLALRNTTTPFAKRGGCVVVLDHVVKNKDNRNGYAIGAGAKKRPIRGAYLQASKVSELAPGKVGRIRLAIEKDTHGSLRRAGDGKTAGVFVLDATDPEHISWRVETGNAAGDAGYFRPTHLMERVSRWIAERPGTHSRDRNHHRRQRKENGTRDGDRRARPGRFRHCRRGDRRHPTAAALLPPDAIHRSRIPHPATPVPTRSQPGPGTGATYPK